MSKFTRGDWLTAGAIGIGLLGAGFTFFSKVETQGVRLERTEADIKETKADVKDMSSELRGFRNEWSPRLREPE